MMHSFGVKVSINDLKFYNNSGFSFLCYQFAVQNVTGNPTEEHTGIATVVQSGIHFQPGADAPAVVKTGNIHNVWVRNTVAAPNGACTLTGTRDSMI